MIKKYYSILVFCNYRLYHETYLNLFPNHKISVKKDSIMDLKQICSENILSNKSIPKKLSLDILKFAESGFKEYETAKKVIKTFEELGQNDIQTGIALTGIKTTLDTGNPGPNIGVIGELDALPAPGHPFENPETSMAHACGHHAQIGSMISVLVALSDHRILSNLNGKITFFAVPAEEFVEIQWRNEQRKKGKIEFLGGKQEMIKLGAFDDIDIAMMTHTTPRNIKFSYGGTDNGLVAKFIEFKGVASHAGASPESGINALNAANIAINAINAQRETFKDEDHIRVHPIITKGGNVVSAVPDQVNIETFIRGSTIDAIQDANIKVDNCLKAGALATGAKVKITTIAGYLPLQNNPELLDIYTSNLKDNFSEKELEKDGHSGGSTDMGDISNLIPSIHPYVGGCSGISNHSKDMVVENYDLSVIESGRMMAYTIIDLLENNAKNAKKIIHNFSPNFEKEEYIKLLRNLTKEEEFSRD